LVGIITGSVTKHGQTAIVMQYGHLQNSLTCVTTSCSNDSFASPTQRTNQLLDKVLWNFVPQVRDAPTLGSDNDVETFC
jgi:hypothetical protein